jgi:hypothetical protein
LVATEQDGRAEQHEPTPANGQLTGWQPSPSSPPVPKQFWKPVKLLMLNGAPSVQTRSMLVSGRLMVAPQPGLLVCEVVPPGHSAPSNAPPLLLFTVKVKFCVPQHTPVGVHTPPLHESTPLQLCPSLQNEPFGSCAEQLSADSLHDSLQLLSPSAPGHGLPA